MFNPSLPQVSGWAEVQQVATVRFLTCLTLTCVCVCFTGQPEAITPFTASSQQE